MKYGYRMYDCTMEQFLEHRQQCYENKTEHDPREMFEYKIFPSVEKARAMIKHILVPASDGRLGQETWTLQEDTLLIKEVRFESEAHANTYQTAIDRAWALGGHLDHRVEQSYYD